MFRLIKIETFAEIIRKDWFFIPATTLALASAIHLTDVRAGIVRGTRTLVLNLLSWLLPLIVAIAVGFLIALLFTGLQPLWDTRRATSILLTAVATIIVLINTTYQDRKSDDGTAKNIALCTGLSPLSHSYRWSRSPLTGCRCAINQYGLSPARISVIACVLVGTCYSIGYLISAIRSGLNCTILRQPISPRHSLLSACYLHCSRPSPIRRAFPWQIRSAAWKSGKISAEKFDFTFLRFNSGRYGEQALEALKHKSGSPEADRNRLQGKTKRWTGRRSLKPIETAL